MNFKIFWFWRPWTQENLILKLSDLWGRVCKLISPVDFGLRSNNVFFKQSSSKPEWYRVFTIAHLFWTKSTFLIQSATTFYQALRTGSASFDGMQYFMYVLIYVSAYWVVKHAWCWMLFKGLCRDLRAKGQSTAQRQQEIIRTQTLWPGKDIWNTSLCRLVFIFKDNLIFNVLFLHHICEGKKSILFSLISLQSVLAYLGPIN